MVRKPRNTRDPAPARRRGRPLGSAPFRRHDEELLARYADKAIHIPGFKLAPFARRAGASSLAAVRRLQARWRADRERFLNEAWIRFDARRAGVSVADRDGHLGRAWPPASNPLEGGSSIRSGRASSEQNSAGTRVPRLATLPDEDEVPPLPDQTSAVTPSRGYLVPSSGS